MHAIPTGAEPNPPDILHAHRQTLPPLFCLIFIVLVRDFQVNQLHQTTMPDAEAQSTHTSTNDKNTTLYSNHSSVISSNGNNNVVVRSENGDNNQEEDTIDYVSGWKLAIVIASIALSCFLMLLDTMIISTVSHFEVKKCCN